MGKPQQRKSSLSADDRRLRELKIATFNKAIDKHNYLRPPAGRYPPGTPGRYGILDFGKRADGTPLRSFFDHQAIAAQNVVSRSRDAPYTQRKGKGMLILHAPGMGKTITGVGCIGAIDAAGVPFGRDEKHLILVPTSLFSPWRRTAEKWFDCTSNFSDEEKARRGDGVLYAKRWQDLTEEAIANAKIIVTTPTAVRQAYKTFMFLQKSTYWTSGKVTGKQHQRTKHEWLPKRGKPVHPFFRYMRTWRGGFPAFATVVADEIPTYCNPTTALGMVVQECCDSAVYVVALSGKPGRARPKQMAHLCRTACWKPTEYHAVRNWNRKRFSNGTAVSRETVLGFHRELVDLADETVVDLPPVRITRVVFNAGIPAEHIDTVNGWLRYAKLSDAEKKKLKEAGEDGDVLRELESQMLKGIAKMVNYSMDSTLGKLMASGFKRELNKNRARALRAPSEQTEIILREARSHQEAGDTRILIIVHCATYGRILKDAFKKRGGYGKLLRYMGGMSYAARERALEQFLPPEGTPMPEANPPKRILFMSRAGTVGTNVAPGVWTVFIVGDVPFNNSCIEQAYSRVRRITQPEGTKIEVKLFEPRNSIISAKYVQHIDKRERLERALNKADFSKFDDAQKDVWRLNGSLVSDLNECDENGNYPETMFARNVRLEWEADRTKPKPPEAEPPNVLRAWEMPLQTPLSVADRAEAGLSPFVPADSDPVESDSDDDLDIFDSDYVVTSEDEDEEPEVDEDGLELSAKRKGKRPIAAKPKSKRVKFESADAQLPELLADIRQSINDNSDWIVDDDAEAEEADDEEEEEEEGEGEDSEEDEEDEECAADRSADAAPAETEPDEPDELPPSYAASTPRHPLFNA